MRYVAGQPAERILPPGSFASIGQALPPGEPLSTEERIRILVWNIYKQQRAEWLSVLKNYGKDAHLVLLQEAQTTPELVQFATANYLAADQVPAFVLPQHPSGVMTLSAAHPVYCCPLREREPILRLAKSALVTVYPLPDTRLLMVVNIHAVNFSLGVDVYSKQLLPIGDQIAHHSGPVIMAGDFNAWSRRRMNALYRFAREMSLRQVRFTDDQRRRAFGRPLDFVFYRGLNVSEASVLVTRASDHNPLLVEFSPGKPDKKGMSGLPQGRPTFGAAQNVSAVVAYDLSAHMLDVVAQAAEARQLKNITTRQGYAESLPFADNAFDIVISRYSAHHWHDVGAALREVNRILKPGGRLIVMDVMSPGHPVRDIWLQTVEALRDTSHVRNYASGEWLTLINEANLIVDNLITDKLPLEFSSWVARMRTPEALVDAIRIYQQSASTEVRTYFALQNDGFFTSDIIMVDAHKAA